MTWRLSGSACTDLPMRLLARGESGMRMSVSYDCHLGVEIPRVLSLDPAICQFCVFSPNHIDYPIAIWAVHRFCAAVSCVVSILFRNTN